MQNKFEELVDQIEHFIEQSKFYPLSQTKIVVNKEELEELLRELRMKTPSEIKRYQKMLNNRDAILSDAQQRAEDMLDEANKNKQELVSEHEIMQQAYEQADNVIEEARRQAEMIVGRAEADAASMKEGAIAYVSDSLEQMQKLLGTTMESIGLKTDHMMETLNGYYERVTQDRNELIAMNSEPEPELDDAEDDYSKLEELSIPEINFPE